MKTVNRDELLQLFDEEVRERVLELLSKPGVRGCVVFENLMFDSSWCGARTAYAFGPRCAHAKPEDFEGKWLNELPSQRQYPRYVYYGPRGQLTLWRLE